MSTDQAPPSWRRSTLGEIGTYLNGRGFKRSEWRQAGRPIIRIQNLTGSSSAFNYFEGEAEDRYVARPGDLLMSWAATLGAYFWNGPEAVVNQHIFKVESKIDKGFHKYLLDFKLAELMRHTHGSGMVHITRGRFENVPVCVPDLAEQRRIVDILEGHLSRLEVAARTLEVQKARAQVLRRAAYRHAFDALKAPTRHLMDVATIANGQTPRGLAEKLHSDRIQDYIPFFKVGDMNAGDGRLMSATRNYIAREDAETLRLHLRGSGTLLIPKRGGAIATNKKRLLTSESAYDLNTMGIVPSEALLPIYLWHWFQMVDLAQLADGSNVPQINAPQIRSLSLPVPSLKEQAALIEHLDEVYASVARFEYALVTARQRSSILTSALLKSAFAGRLTGDRTSQDEPLTADTKPMEIRFHV